MEKAPLQMFDRVFNLPLTINDFRERTHIRFIYIYIYIYKESLQALTIKLTIKQEI